MRINFNRLKNFNLNIILTCNKEIKILIEHTLLKHIESPKTMVPYLYAVQKHVLSNTAKWQGLTKEGNA